MLLLWLAGLKYITSTVLASSSFVAQSNLSLKFKLADVTKLELKDDFIMFELQRVHLISSPLLYLEDCILV